MPGSLFYSRPTLATSNRCSAPTQSVAIESLESRRMLSAAPTLASAAAGSTPNVVDLQAQFVSSPVCPIHLGKAPVAAAARLRISNVGDATARGPLSVLVYLSTDSTLGGGDVLVGHAAAPHASIKAEKSKTLAAQLRFPANTATGNYHLIAVVDPAGTIPGNIAAGSALVAPTTITLSLGHQHDHQPGDGGSDTIDDGSTGDDTTTNNSDGNSNNSSTTEPTTSSSDGDSNSSTTQSTTSSSDDSGSDFGSSAGDDSGGADGGGADF